MVWRSIPPELSAPSLSSTIAPSGSEDDSASTRSSVSPMREAVAAPAADRSSGSAPAPCRTCTAAPGTSRRDSSAARRRAAPSPQPRACPTRRSIDMLRESSTKTATTFCWGLQRRDTQRRMPQQKQNEGDHASFEPPDRDRAQAAEHPVIAANVPEKRARDCQDRNREQPQRPRRQENELAFVENAGRIFEQKFKHEVHVAGESRQVYGRASGRGALQTTPN